MSIHVADHTKFLLARRGPNKLFGENIDERRELSDHDALRLFSGVWQQSLERAITNASRCDSYDAHGRIKSSEQEEFDFSQEHRMFRIQEVNAEFVVQLNSTFDSQGNANSELTYLWQIPVSEAQDKILVITFGAVEQREQFRQLANNLGTNDEELGLQLVMDFMAKHPDRFLDDQL